eukprot:3821170-Heterocapsa_arctica.AAC.1
MRSVRQRCRSDGEYPLRTAAMHCMLSSRHIRPTLRSSAYENNSTIGRASDFSALDMEMYSASHVLEA